MTSILIPAAVLAGLAAVLAVWALSLRRRAAAAHRRLVELEAEKAEARAACERAVASEARFRALVEAADDIIFRTDAEGRFSYANPAAVEALGGNGGLVGASFLDVVRPDYREEARRFYDEQRRLALPNTYCEFPVVTRAGEELWLGQRVQLVEGGTL